MNQLEKTIEVIQIDHGGQYYKRYNQTKHNILESFSLHFQEYGIVARYNMSGTPQENDVVERRNRTLMDMVWSMLCNATLLGLLWIEALRSVHIS